MPDEGWGVIRLDGVILDVKRALPDSRDLWFARRGDVARTLGAEALRREDCKRTFGQSTARLLFTRVGIGARRVTRLEPQHQLQPFFRLSQ